MNLITQIAIYMSGIFILFGNQAYFEELYETAIDNYEIAQTLNDETGVANLNAGNSAYRLEEYDQALEFYLNGLAEIEISGKTEHKAELLYNIGNTHFRLGEKVIQTDPEKTLEHWLTAIIFYELALQENPDDQEAKENIEFIKNLLQQQKENTEKEDDDDEKEKPQQIQYDQEEFTDVNPDKILEEEQENRDNYNNRKKWDDYEDNPTEKYGEPGW